ncbi:MAG: hypothetical protein EA344_02735 [Alkalicoccus sp.]|nr:MAG: hypothetical protein EA344_02735 [Alkalicoccus sp.]
MSRPFSFIKRFFFSETFGGDAGGIKRSLNILSEEAQLRQKQLKTIPTSRLSAGENYTLE